MKRFFNYIDIHRTMILSFLSVGALSAVINILSFALLLTFTPIHYETAVSIAFILSVIFHFTANRHFTFHGTSKQLHVQLPKYMSMVFINYLMTLAVMFVVVEIIHLSPYIGNVAAIGVTVCMSFFMSRYWVFV